MLLLAASALLASLPIQPPVPVIASGTPETASIFMGLSAYRDIRCGYTLIDAFERAENPHRITFGIVEQLAQGDRKCIDVYCELASKHTGSLFQTDDGSCKFKEQIQPFYMDYTESKGPIIARANQQTLIKDEEFCLQVDAHTNFATSWDTKLVKQWKATGNDNAILTTYVQDIAQRDSGEHDAPPVMCETQWGSNDLVRNSQAHTMNIGDRPKLNKGLWGAGESFSKCRAEKEVPNDRMLPHIFDGEEESRAIRLWTNGWDFYTPNTNLIYHDYLKKMGPKDEVEKSVWGSHPPPASTQLKKASELAGSVKRLKVLFRMPSASSSSLRGADIEEPQPQLGVGELYGLGTKRTYEQYVQFSGMDPSRHIAANGNRCTLDNLQDWVPFAYSKAEPAAAAAEVEKVKDASAMTTHMVKQSCEMIFIASLFVLLMAVFIAKRRSLGKSASRYLPLHQQELMKEIGGEFKFEV